MAEVCLSVIHLLTDLGHFYVVIGSVEEGSEGGVGKVLRSRDRGALTFGQREVTDTILKLNKCLNSEGSVPQLATIVSLALHSVFTQPQVVEDAALKTGSGK